MSDLFGSDLFGAPSPAADPAIRERLAPEVQRALVEAVREVLRAAPLFQPTMPRTGKPFSVRMTNCGALGWVSDSAGYRYQPTHPATGTAWPPIPGLLLDLWARHAGDAPPPEACLVNWYEADARMGLHQDRDEETFEAPVLSVSLGDDCRFRIGGTRRTTSGLSPPTTSRMTPPNAAVITPIATATIGPWP